MPTPVPSVHASVNGLVMFLYTYCSCPCYVTKNKAVLAAAADDDDDDDDYFTLQIHT